jgi:arylsulfatase A-like enzyme
MNLKLCSLALALNCAIHPIAASAKPNIILIIADDLGYGDLGCHGATKIKTPHIDKLASTGLRSTAAYAPASTCTPTRYSILTGDYPWRQKERKTTILDGDAPLSITPGSATLPATLKAAGYTTGIVGKWHLGLGDGITPVDFNGEIKPGPLEVGFDYCHIIPATVDRVPSVWIENHRIPNLDPQDPIRVSYIENISDEPTGIERPDLLKQKADKQHSNTIHNGISRIGFMKGGHAARFKDEELPATVIAKSEAFIQRHKDSPFFLTVGLFEPHVPRIAAPHLQGSSDCGIRGDVIQQIDWQVGELMKTLEKNNLTNNTIVIITSDNGPLFFDGYFDKSAEEANGHDPAGGLRGGKYNVFEGGCRVPFIASWPGHIASSVSSDIISLSDLYATCASIAGTTVKSGTTRDSIDQSSKWLGKSQTTVRDSVVLQGISGSIAIRSGEWKLIPSNAKAGVSGTGSGANAADPRFAAATISETLLFNLAQDPSESRNLAAENPEKVTQLTDLLHQLGAPLPANN